MVHCILLTGGVAEAASKTLGPTSLQSTTPPKVSEDELRRRYEMAQSLDRKGELQAALKEYRFVFDNSRDTAFDGVRLSFLLSDVYELGDRYPQARAWLVERRDISERAILARRGGDYDFAEVTALNETLGTPKRNLALFDRLKAGGRPLAQARSDLVFHIWEQMVAARRYKDFAPYSGDIVEGILQSISAQQMALDFPKKPPLNDPEVKQVLRRQMVNQAALGYEALLGVRKRDTAAKLKKWLLRVARDGETYTRLVRASRRAGDLDTARGLVREARKALPAKQLAPVEAALKD
jgi:tetratricopeptide (TPR) repeat protein